MVESEILTPIQVGCTKSSFRLPMLHDDEGDNISIDNDKFCELTGQYWAWKNIEADYYGFMHYRRHFVFKEIEEEPRTDGTILFSEISESYLEHVGLDNESIERCVKGYDLILPRRIDVTGWDALNNEIQFSSLSNLHAKDFDIACKVTKELYPEYADVVEKFRNGHYAYWFNMFIMKKWIFQKYNKWLFSILMEAKKRVNYKFMNAQEKRTLAFMAERLFSIFVMKLLEDNKELKVKNLKMTFLDSTESMGDKKGMINKEGWEKACNELCYIGHYDIMIPDYEYCKAIIRDVRSENLIFYGAGRCCRKLLDKMDKLEMKYPKKILDINAEKTPQLFGVKVCYPNFDDMERDSVYVITVLDRVISNNIKENMIKNGVKNVYVYTELNRALLCKLWQKKISEGLGNENTCSVCN